MERITCSECGREYSSELGNCPSCGSRNLDFVVQNKKVNLPKDDEADFAFSPLSSAQKSAEKRRASRDEEIFTRTVDDEEDSRIPYWLKTVILIVAGLAVIIAAVFAILSLDIFDLSLGGNEAPDTVSATPSLSSTVTEPAVPATPALVVTPPVVSATPPSADILAPAAPGAVGDPALPAVTPGVPDGAGEGDAEEPPVEATPVVDVECNSIDVNRTDITFFSRGESYRLVASCDPFTADEYVVWESEDPTIAKVDENGYVTAVSGGTVYVTASCGDKSASCIVRCAFEAVGEVMFLNYEDVSLFSGGEKLNLAVSDELTAEEEAGLVWESSNPEVATVDENGVVTAVSSGTVEVSATIGEKVGVCIVRVNIANQGSGSDGTQLSLNHSDVTLFNVGEYVQLKVEGEGVESSGISWTSQDEDVATVDSTGLVKAVANGTTKVSTVVDGVTLSCIVRVNIG